MNDMKEKLQTLAEWGCDIEGALERFLEDDELYMTCLETLVVDNAYEKLGKALAEGKVAEAFDYAHTLKGVLSNLGLTPMICIVEKIVEPLRAGFGEGLEEFYEQLLDANEHLKCILGM